MAEDSRHSRHARRRSGLPGYPAALAAAVVAILLIGGLAGYLIGRSGSSTATAAPPPAGPTVAPVPAAASTGLPAHPTMMGDVTRIVSGDEVVVHSGTEDMTVKMLGLTTPDPMAPGAGGTTAAACGSREALQFADSQLTGQRVTLVPDPTIPETDDQGRRLAYVVLHTQMNYTDAALSRGIGRADTSRPLWYADTFTHDQETAVDRGEGIWGSPCNERP